MVGEKKLRMNIVRDENITHRSLTEKIASSTNPEMFNQGWGSKDVPSIDALYRNARIDIKGREPKHKKEQQSADPDRVERVISMAEQMTAAATEIKEEPEEVKSEVVGSEETEDPFGMAKAVLEIVIEDKEEDEGSGEVEFPDYEDYYTSDDEVADEY